eukprot:5789505-Amphidinium_carterae.1
MRPLALTRQDPIGFLAEFLRASAEENLQASCVCNELKVLKQFMRGKATQSIAPGPSFVKAHHS